MVDSRTEIVTAPPTPSAFLSFQLTGTATLHQGAGYGRGHNLLVVALQVLDPHLAEGDVGGFVVVLQADVALLRPGAALGLVVFEPGRHRL